MNQDKEPRLTRDQRQAVEFVRHCVANNKYEPIEVIPAIFDLVVDALSNWPLEVTDTEMAEAYGVPIGTMVVRNAVYQRGDIAREHILIKNTPVFRACW